MKNIYKIFFLAMFFVKSTKDFAQTQEPKKLIRIFEDDDFFNITGHGTDKSYTNGTRIDFFYQEKNPSNSFIDRLMPKAGDSSLNVFAWSIMQAMVTPNNISTPKFQPNDYAYAGALFISHSLYSYSAIKKYSLQTEFVVGVRGPASFAEQAQIAAHSLIGYQKPMGWYYQLSTAPLINVNVTAETQFAAIGNFFELDGGSILRVGSFVDALTVYPMVRIGKMSPYFDGYLNQFGSYKKNGKTIRTQYYFLFKPILDLVAHNALFKGELEHTDPETGAKRTILGHAYNIHHHVPELQLGVVLARGNFGLSYLQTYSHPYKRGLYRHTVGNISLYFRW